MSASYRGRIPPKSNVTVVLSADFSNTGPALLMVGAGDGTDATANSCEVVPGVAGPLKIDLPDSGTFVINIDFKDEDDSGKLEVKVGRQRRDEGAVQGDSDWSYLIKS